LASVGHDVVIGSRELDRAVTASDELRAAWPDFTLAIHGAQNEGAAEAELVVVATPWNGVVEVVEPLADRLAGKVVVSMVNALQRMGREFTALVPTRGSIAANVQAAAPKACVVAALQHVPARELGNLAGPIEADVLVCSDHPDALNEVMTLLAEIPSLRPLDAGPLSSAAPIESFTAVMLQLNVRYRTRVELHLSGIPA
jgi:NADPH-dependent F420 reductase